MYGLHYGLYITTNMVYRKKFESTNFYDKFVIFNESYLIKTKYNLNLIEYKMNRSRLAGNVSRCETTQESAKENRKTLRRLNFKKNLNVIVIEYLYK